MSLPSLSMVSMTDSLPGDTNEFEAPKIINTVTFPAASAAAAAVAEDNNEPLFSQEMAAAAGISAEKQLLIRHMTEEGPYRKNKDKILLITWVFHAVCISDIFKLARFERSRGGGSY